jgi:hypothetical protein
MPHKIKGFYSRRRKTVYIGLINKYSSIMHNKFWRGYKKKLGPAWWYMPEFPDT